MKKFIASAIVASSILLSGGIATAAAPTAPPVRWDVLSFLKAHGYTEQGIRDLNHRMLFPGLALKGDGSATGTARTGTACWVEGDVEKCADGQNGEVPLDENITGYVNQDGSVSGR